MFQERGPSTQRVLADALGVSPRNITGLVDGLEAAGFVVRRSHPSDRRATLVTFTDKGAGIAKEMASGQAELATGLFGPLTDAELATFMTTFGEVVERLKLMIAAAGPASDAAAGTKAD